MRIDQLVPGFARHDAISGHVRLIREALRAAGVDSDIYGGEAVAPDLRSEAPRWTEWAPRDTERALLYHGSTASAMSDWLIERAGEGERVILDYHNITPAEYFDRWLPEAAASMRRARVELAELVPAVGLAVADSRFNEGELTALGYAPTDTCRLLVDLERYHDEPDRRSLDRLRRRRDRSGRRWLFVGRIAPNKCQHDLVAAFAVYRRLYDPRAELTLVGGVSAPRYLRALQALVGRLGLTGSVDLVEGATHAELLAHFATADAMVCLSEHEGFCVPLLEAMELGLPVVAYATAAVPETVAGAGVLLADKDPLAVAVAVAELFDDPRRRAELVAAGKRKAEQWSLPRTSAAMLERLVGHLGG